MTDEFFRSRATYLSLIDQLLSGGLAPKAFVERFLKVRDDDITKGTLGSVEDPPADALEDWRAIYSTIFYACEDVSFEEDRDTDMISPEAFVEAVRAARDEFARLAGLPGSRPGTSLQ